jgi:opacity protein-like surface antigen
VPTTRIKKATGKIVAFVVLLYCQNSLFNLSFIFLLEIAINILEYLYKRVTFASKFFIINLKMRKKLLGAFTVIALLFTITSNAQDTIPVSPLSSNIKTNTGFFFSLNTGYGFGISQSTRIISNATNVYTNYPLAIGTNLGFFSSVNQENIYLSLGKGFNLGGTVGYMFNKNIGAELGINYLSGNKANSTTYTGTYSFNPVSFEDYGKTNISAVMWQFKPTIIITAGMEKINPYAKFGMLFGKGSIYNNQTRINGLNRQQISYNWVYNGGTAVGFHAELGLYHNLNPKTSLFTELSMINMSYAPTKGKLTESKLNGAIDQLPGIPVYYTDIEFTDNVDVQQTNPNVPAKQLKTNFPFNSIGFNFGIKYSL